MSAGENGPVVDNQGAINELLTRAVADVFPSHEELAAELQSGRVLTAYMGIDPTAPDMHVGHQSQLMKLRRLQKLGHNTILLIGDFTAMIGDPTDKSAARVKLTRDEVLENAEGYKAQASKILDFDSDHNPTQLRYNSEWLGGMDFGDVLELASGFTVQQMLERNSFRNRIENGKPVGVHEFMYPMMQGWDSVQMGVDIEVGGSDQIFNMLVGSTLVRRHLEKQKFVIAGDLLADPSGRKIGKTEGNMITLNDDPVSMFHKVMLWGDGITPHALELCTWMPMSEVAIIGQRLESGELSGLEGKKLLAQAIVSELHGESAAVDAASKYQSLSIGHGETDTEGFQAHAAETGQGIVDLLIASGFASSRSAARRLLGGGAVRINGEKIDADWTVGPADGGDVILRVGRIRPENFRRLEISE